VGLCGATREIQVRSLIKEKRRGKEGRGEKVGQDSVANFKTGGKPKAQ